MKNYISYWYNRMKAFKSVCKLWWWSKTCKDEEIREAARQGFNKCWYDYRHRFIYR